MNTSLWRQIEKPRHYPALKSHITADAVVVGGGMAGILCARLLRDAGRRAVLLEAAEIGSGVTGNTTAKITAQHGLCYTRLRGDYGDERVINYARAHFDAIERYAALAKHIACDFERADATVYARDDDGAGKVTEEYDTLTELGLGAGLYGAAELPFPVTAAVTLKNQAKFHPLKFLYGVSEDLEIFEHSRVLEADGNRLVTENGSVEAEKILFCTHYPFINVPGWFFARMYQSRSYVLALEDAWRLDGMYIDCSARGFSLRSHGKLLLFGGEGHHCGETDGGHYEKLENAARELFPRARIACRWSAQDCVTLDNVPYIGRYADARPNWLVATGFAKWGMTGAMVGATILSALAQDRENPYGDVFDPGRFNLGASAGNMGQEVKGMAEGFVVNKAAGRPVCTHLGCSLRKNPDEDSWDCPCHGSRFDRHGAVLDGPAQAPIRDFGNTGV